VGNPRDHTWGILAIVDNAYTTLNPTAENPHPNGASQGVDYGARACNSARVAVYVPTSGAVTKGNTAYGEYSTLVGIGGADWYPGCNNGVAGTVHPGQVDAGNRYETCVSLAYTSGYVGGGGSHDILYPEGGDSDCDSRIVVNEPYVHFPAGDVRAGPGFSDRGSCSIDSTASIHTLTRTTGTRPVGSGAQLAAQALGDIQGFSSANLRELFPTGSTGLTFANTENTSGGSGEAPNTGGRAGIASNYCIADYYDTMPKNTPTDTASTTATINTSPHATDVKSYSGHTITLHGGTVGLGTQQAIYIENGDLYIDGNITFAGADTGWNSLSDIPSLYIIVKNANIYIADNVTQLDGIYVAQPNRGDTTKGVVDTCANGTHHYQATEIFTNCKHQLVVNGAFVANKIFLNRAYSSLRYGQPGESKLYSPAHDCGHPGRDTPPSGPTSNTDCAGEIFNFSPEFYLQQPAITNSGGPTSGRFDSYTSLSPVL
jgi:hypothetical protein